MIRRMHLALAASWVLLGGTTALSLTAQVSLEATGSLSADTVGQGDVFELYVEVRVPSGSAVYFPDTVPSAFGLESFRTVDWKSEAFGDGGMLRLIYPLIAFQVGLVPVPGLDVFVGPATGIEGPSFHTGSVIGEWSGVTSDSGLEALERVPVARQAVWIASPIHPDDISAGLEPRVPSDVLGANWDWPSLILIVSLSIVFLIAITPLVMKMLTDQGGQEELLDASLGLDPALARWQAALDELDQILSLGLHLNGDMEEFYGRSSRAVRTYVEALDAAWGPSFTSSELMVQLRRGINGSAVNLYGSMDMAEVVKFGRLRPDADAAERDWRVLRNWVKESRTMKP
tara:strand:+ start:2780 stop:3811 length:1032 start_codon:yes stop_codon:yes gene_type:complete